MPNLNRKEFSNMKLLILFAMILSLFIILSLQFVNAEASFIYKQNTVVNLKVPVTNNDNSVATSSVSCNITIKYPDETMLVSNGIMEYNPGGIFNYTLNNLSQLGEYSSFMSCTDGVEFGFTSFSFMITTTGNQNNIQTAIFYIVGLLVILFFLGVCILSFVKFDNLLNKVGMIGLSYLLIIAISFIAWQMSTDFLTNISFITRMFYTIFLILMIGILPMVIGGFVWYFIMLFKLKEIQRLMDKGLNYNEAERRGGNKYK